MSKRFFLLLVGLSFLLMPLFANAEVSCRKLFQSEILGYIDANQEQELRFISEDIKSGFYGKEIAIVEFDYFEDSQTLYIGWINVNSKFQGSGLSNQLITKLLQEYPHTQKISGYLTDTNLAAYSENLRKTQDSNLAVKATPFYQSFAAVGFAKIVENTYYDNKVILVLKK